MSRQVRNRVTALVAGCLLLGAPLLVNGTASADQVDEGGQQVAFAGGGVLGLSCRSRPDVESMTVPANSTIRMINHTGHTAQLRLGGAVQGRVPDDGSTEVRFRRGTTAVSLTPACALGDQATPLLVTAVPSDPAAMPDPIPVPSQAADPASPSPDRSSPPASASGPALPDSVPPAAGQPRPAAGRTTRGGGSRPATAVAAAQAQAMPQGGGASPRLRTTTARGVGGTTPAFSGMPPGDHQRLLPGVPAIGLSQTTERGPVRVPPSEVVAAEPVAAMAALPESRPVGLLTLTAIICVLGVSAAAIRAIVLQRACRTQIG
jgi:hypothetical protein